jgi:hypothetical protein
MGGRVWVGEGWAGKGWAHYLLQYTYFPCTKFTSKIKEGGLRELFFRIFFTMGFQSRKEKKSCYLLLPGKILTVLRSHPYTHPCMLKLQMG